MSLSHDQRLAIRAAARRAAYRYFLHPQPADVEDLAQEVAAKALANLHRFDPTKAEWTTWVNTIASNTAIDMGKKKKPLRLADGFDAPARADNAPDEAVLDLAREVRRLLPKAPLDTRVVLSALNPELFPPCDAVQAGFEKRFKISWTASRELPEWSEPTPEFLAARAGVSKNTLVDQPLCRLRKKLARELGR